MLQFAERHFNLLIKELFVKSDQIQPVPTKPDQHEKIPVRKIWNKILPSVAYR